MAVPGWACAACDGIVTGAALSGGRCTLWGMDDEAALRGAFLAAVEAHKTHRPRLYRGADGIYRCPQCHPPGLRERMTAWRERAVDAVRGRGRR